MLKVGFQPLKRSYHRLQVGFGGVGRCRHSELSWARLAWAEGSTPGSSEVSSHRLSSATGEHNHLEHLF